MKKKTADFLMGLAICAAVLAGCGTNKATEAANESIKTEQEGKGTAEAPEKEKEETDSQEAEEPLEEEPAPVVGVFFPTEASDEAYERDAIEMAAQLEEAGYAPRVLYGDQDAHKQISQIEDLLVESPAALVVCPVDPYGLGEALGEAKELSIPVIAYDELIMNTDAVNYYVTFDTRGMGHAAGEKVIKEKELDKLREKKEACTIEFLMGSPDDAGALFLYNGIMESLQGYLEDGTLVCPSAQTSFDDTSVMRWSREAARTDLDEVLQEFYGQEERPDIICTASDEFALSAAEALKERGILPGDENWPLITGAGALASAVKDVAEGGIGFTLWMDGRELAKECASVVDTLLKGEDLEVDDYEQYDNGVKILGTCIGEGQVVDSDNYRMLSDSGYYPEEEIRPALSATPEPSPEETPAEKPEETPMPEKEQDPEVTPAPEEPTVTPTLKLGPGEIPLPALVGPSAEKEEP